MPSILITGAGSGVGGLCARGCRASEVRARESRFGLQASHHTSAHTLSRDLLLKNERPKQLQHARANEAHEPPVLADRQLEGTR